MSDFENTLSEVKKNQWNCWGNDFYNEFEINKIVSELRCILSSEEYSSSVSKWALVCLLSVNMSCTDKEVLEYMVLGNDKDSSISSKNNNVIFINNEKFRLIFTSPDDGHEPKEQELPYLEKYQEYIDLPIHPTLSLALKNFLKDGVKLPVKISELISLSYEEFLEIKAKGNRLLNNINVSSIGRRKLANIIPAKLVKNSKDIILAEKLRCQENYFNSLSIFYYASYRTSGLHEKYLNCLNEIFGDTNNEKQQLELNLFTDDVFIGSKVTIREEKLRRFVSNITEDTKKSLKKLNYFDDLIEAHNSYAIYVITQLLDVTGVRPSKDVFVRKSTFLNENNGIIISDKKTITGNEGRLLSVPSQCINQINEYLEHLKALAGRIAEYDKKIAKKIWFLTQETEELMPLFFLINKKGKWRSIGEYELENYHSKYWPLYCKCFRQNLISELIKFDVDSEYILYQIGHERAGEDPYSPFSVLSHKALSEIMTPVLEKIWSSHGWKVLTGLSKYQKRNVGFIDAKIEFEKVYLGSEKRKINRELINGSDSKEKVKQNKFNESNQKLIGFGNDIRNNLYKAIINRYEAKKENPMQQLACIWLLCVVYDGVLDENYYKYFSESVISFSQKHKGKLYIRLKHKDYKENAPFKIWMPSPIAASIILNFLEKDNALNNELNAKDISSVKKTAAQIIKSIRCERYEEFFRGGERIILKNLKESCYLIKPLLIPSIFSEISFNKLDETSLCDSGVQRLLHGNKAIIKNKAFNNQKNEPNVVIDNTNAQLKFNRYLKDDKKTCRKYDKNCSIDNVKGKTKRRRAASREILGNMGKRNTVPLISYYFTLWGYNLLSGKSLYDHYLEPETVAKYMEKVGRAIYDFGFEVKDVEYDEEYFKNIFEQIIKQNENNVKLFERYIDFYEFISDEYSYDKIDFNEIASGANFRQARVKANVVFFNEYIKALKNIDNRKDLNGREKIQCKTLFILTFRCGGRISEIYGLKIKDLILEENSHIRIENNFIRPVKTDNAKRKVILLLTEEEKRVLNDWVRIRNNDEIGDDEDALFSDGRVFRKNSQYWKFTTLIRDTLRDVTGDPDVNIHSLRHSYANYNFIWMTMANENNNIWQVNDWLKGTLGENKTYEKIMLNCEYPTRRSLYFLAHHMGHGSPETTIKNYIHCSPWLMHDYAVINVPKLNDKQISVLSQIPEANVPKYRKRKGDKKGEFKNIISWRIDNSKVVSEKVNNHRVKHIKLNNKLNVSEDIHLATLSCILTDIKTLIHNDILLKHGLDDKGLNKLLEAAKRIEEKTGYNNFNIVEYITYGGSSKGKIKTKRPRNNVNHKIVKNIELLLKNKNRELLDTLKIWAKYYRARHSGLFVSNTNEGRIISGLLRMIGLKNDLCLIETSSIKKLSKIKKENLLRRWKKETGINKNIEKSVKDTGVCVKDKSDILNPVPGITITNKSKKGIEKSGFHYLHHSFYLCLVLLKWQSLIESQ